MVDEGLFANGDDNEISILEIHASVFFFGLRMKDGDVAVLVEKKSCHRFANNVAST